MLQAFYKHTNKKHWSTPICLKASFSRRLTADGVSLPQVRHHDRWLQPRDPGPPRHAVYLGSDRLRGCAGLRVLQRPGKPHRRRLLDGMSGGWCTCISVRFLSKRRKLKPFSFNQVDWLALVCVRWRTASPNLKRVH